ncbi:MAG: OmpA family protein [Deltaproteobacteria bacterium]|nr:OmpA family protein [Deltaproteobacteria bacterium]
MIRRPASALALVLAIPSAAQAAEDRAEGTADTADTADTTDAGSTAEAEGHADTAASTDVAFDAGDAESRRMRRALADDDIVDGDSDTPWIRRWAPVANSGELGAYTGAFVPGRQHELYDVDPALPDQGYHAYGQVAPAVGVRVGYYPLRFLGVEGEGGIMPTRAGGERATLWTVRGSVVGQVGLWRLTPFVVLGAGGLAVTSSRAAVGNDIDTAMHVGGGIKFFSSKHTQVRLDVRDVISQRQGPGSRLQGDNIEATLSVAVNMGFGSKRRKSPEVPDRDGDGVLDRVDRCVMEAGSGPYGCPARDSDGDGVLDVDDRCIAAAGEDAFGCPPPDRDADGVEDTEDQCPTRAGFGGNGCPADFDVDGVSTIEDQCEVDPETHNGFEDRDGCPDVLPHEIAELKTVQVRFGRSRYAVPRGSKANLDHVAVVLHRFPELRIAVVGHTDSEGPHVRNVALSGRRAQSVRAHLIESGINPERIEIRAVGPDKPLASNDRTEGRAENRRTELEILR